MLMPLRVYRADANVWGHWRIQGLLRDTVLRKDTKRKVTFVVDAPFNPNKQTRIFDPQNDRPLEFSDREL